MWICKCGRVIKGKVFKCSCGRIWIWKRRGRGKYIFGGWWK